MSNKLNILVLTKYDNKGASSRLRSIQYFEHLTSEGVTITHAPLFDDKYLYRLYANEKISILYIFARYFKRVLQLFKSPKYDLLWIEKELFPWIPINIEGLLKFLHIKYIVDYDDAIFHNYDLHSSVIVKKLLSTKIPNVMRNATLVTVCNDYLEEKALEFGAKNIIKIPTVVDLNRYSVSHDVNNSQLIIGWIGTLKTEKYLIELTGMLEKLSKKLEYELVVIGGGNFNSSVVNYKFLEWSEDKETQYLREIDIGIMPLMDSKWEKGKCAYKLIQYMACAKPVVASSVGMNCEVVQDDVNGFLVNNEEEWLDSFLKLNNVVTRVEMGENARKLVEAKYSLQSTIAIRMQSIKKGIER